SGIPTPQTPVGRTLLNYSIANRNPYRINLVGIDPATFAEQLTLLEHELFTRVTATEFSLKGRVGNLETILHTMQGAAADSRSSVSGAGPGTHGQYPANPVPHLVASTSWFNQATYWAVLSVLSEPTTAARALVVKQLIHIAFHCLARRNYYGAFEISIALDNSAVRRLHETWALIPPLMKDIVNRMLEVLQSRMNYRVYRESVKAALSGASGPDEDVFDAISEQIKAIRTKDMVASSQTNIVTSGGVSSAATATGQPSGFSGSGHASHPSAPSGFGHIVQGALFNSEDSKQHLRKKSIAHLDIHPPKDAAMLTEQDCACIMYAIRIRAASFAFFDPSSSGSGDYARGGVSSSHTSAPVLTSSKSRRGSSGHPSASSGKGTGGSAAAASTGASDGNEGRARRARSTSNSAGGTTPNGKQGGQGPSRPGCMATNNSPLPVVPFVAVHMTDLLHADEANATYSDEHPQKMHSRNPTGPDTDLSKHLLGEDRVAILKRKNGRCDSTAVSYVNQAQPLLNMQKFRLITSMFRELCMAQRTKYPYMPDVTLQQQIHNAVRNIKAQTNDIFGVVQDVAFEDPSLTRPTTPFPSPFCRGRTGSSASRYASSEGDESTTNSSASGTLNNNSNDDSGSFGYPLYRMAASQRNMPDPASVEGSMSWDGADLKENQELEQRLYDLSRWVEPPARHHSR
ncbi:hypothetical protein GGI12_003747, partial [Dipsacomyces acuminosporus]